MYFLIRSTRDSGADDVCFEQEPSPLNLQRNIVKVAFQASTAHPWVRACVQCVLQAPHHLN
jgi:hypothetical protein